ncbi:MAG TPA: serine/threonine-protein kinase [Polyangiaceae bacterium]|jgi:serine/threonine-protein kinase
MSAPVSPLPESVGRYRVVRLLGQGAMGRVLLAHDPILDRDVAVKLLRDDLRLPDDQRRALVDRMRQEARAAARVSHPHIVAMHDMGEHDEIGLYLVFEYAEGVTLKDRLREGTLDPGAAAKLAREIGDALTALHRSSVLHRDVKPENIILTPIGCKLADFGIARVPDSTLTRDGGLLGTPAYSAPESIAVGRFSPASDQFSMATTLYEAVCGRRAFPGDDAMAVASRIATEQPMAFASQLGLDPRVDEVFERAFSKEPADRFESAAEFGEVLEQALSAPARNALPTIPDHHHAQALERESRESHTLRTALGGAAVGALLSIAGFQVTAHLKERDDATAPSPAPPRPVLPLVREPPPVGYLAEDPEVNIPQRRAPLPSASAAVETELDAGPPEDPEPELSADAAAGEADAATPLAAPRSSVHRAPHSGKPPTSPDVNLGQP